ncbi:YitT family protein [Anaeromicropila herbilytica]|uniref:Membrane protein n=1 Tax=Anaeromicropila herbilytica TaxID=2785025 RepID=A0A7R7IEU7_9FIRM|nr:YitT family protein [Anaeromicropila herbilytica]BCN32494.1 membrane protein [Anaeromicropila herbilytica]
MTNKKKHVIRVIKKYILLFLGSLIAAVGLEIFLVPNNIIDGGIVGISIIASYLSKIPIGAFTFVLNLPFLIIGYKQIGKTFVLSSLFSITTFSIFTEIFHPIPGLTKDVLLAAVFGGIILGIGVGLILRYGGSLDGSEIIAIILNKGTLFSVGQIVMFFNIIIFTLATFVLGWDRALYSMLAYFVAHKAIDVVIEGFDEAKAVFIITDHGDEIADAIVARLGRGVTYLEGQGGFSKDRKTILYSVVTRLEISKLRSIINDKDENAFVTINDVSDVMGGSNQKRAIH